jgi:hypothetical protein
METIALSKTNVPTCNSCGEHERGNIHIHTCDLCFKDICIECSTSVNANGGGTLFLCYECAKLDFTEYQKIFDEVEELHNKIKILHRRGHDVLVRMHRDNPTKETDTQAIINEDKPKADVSLLQSSSSC